MYVWCLTESSRPNDDDTLYQPTISDAAEVADLRVPKSRKGRDDTQPRVAVFPCNGAKGNKLTLAELRLTRIEEKRMADKSWNAAWYARTGRFG